MNTKLMHGAEPFFIPGGRIGCLCVHGLTASPQEVYWLGTYLAQHGASVCAPRLYGHGVEPSHIRRARWQDWYLSVLDGYHLLRRQCDQVITLGLSLGGLLSLRLAADEPVAAVVAMAAPVRLSIKNIRLVHLLRYFGATVIRFDRAADPINTRIEAIQRERGEGVTGRVAYYEHSAAGTAELLKLQTEVKAGLSRITAPTLLIFSEADRTVPIENIDLIAGGLTACPDVQIVRLKQSDHILTNDIEYMQVFESAWSFIERVADGKHETLERAST
jgi:carboxylesterase